MPDTFDDHPDDTDHDTDHSRDQCDVGGLGTPSNLRLAGSTASSLTLWWDGSPSASYDILRSGVRIATVAGTSFTDIGLMPNTPYIYAIRGTTTTPEQTFAITR